MTTSSRPAEGARQVNVAELADGGPVGEPLLDGVGQVQQPLLCVDVDGKPEPGIVAAAARVAAGVDRILVGVATRAPLEASLRPLLRALDLTVVPLAAAGGGPELVAVADPVSHAVELHARARENPQAATVLAGLLRWSGSLAMPTALDAESLAYSTLLGGAEFRQWLGRRGPRPFPPPAVDDPVRVSRDEALLHITLNRPERRNAYGRQLRDALVAALDIAVFDPGIQRVLLDGAGPSFSSGGDLDEFGTTPDVVTAHFVRTRAGAARLLHRLADRVEVRVHGGCVGAGIELPAFAGHVVAAPGTTFRLPEIAMGLIPGAGGTVSIPRRIGRWRCLDLALTGAPLDTGTALEWGLIDEVR